LTPAARRGRWPRRKPTPGWRRSPPRPQAALTVAGTVSGWDEALKVSQTLTGKALPLARLLEDAIRYAADGTPVTASQSSASAGKLAELRDLPGFAETFLVNGQPPVAGSRFRSPRWHHA
jgi:gamma-glutamyltranspeptidase/glutathione hydrolase